MAKLTKFRKAASLKVYMPVSELADRIGVTTSTVYLWMQQETSLLPPFTVFGPRTKLFKRSDVDAWIADNTEEEVQKPDVKQVRVDVDAGRRDATPKTSHVTHSKPVVERKKNDYERLQEIREKHALSDYPEDEKPTTK